MGFLDAIGDAVSAAVGATGDAIAKGDIVGAALAVGGGVQNTLAGAANSAIPGSGVVFNPNLGVVAATAPATLLGAGVEGIQGIDVFGGKGVTAGITKAELDDPHLFAEAIGGAVGTYEGVPGAQKHLVLGIASATSNVINDINVTAPADPSMAATMGTGQPGDGIGGNGMLTLGHANADAHAQHLTHGQLSTQPFFPPAPLEGANKARELPGQSLSAGPASGSRFRHFVDELEGGHPILAIEDLIRSFEPSGSGGGTK